MATLPDGTLMQRAAAGLARRCALLLGDRGGVYGARVLLLVGSGDNGGDALYAGARLARPGRRGAGAAARPGPGAPGRAGRAAGGRRSYRRRGCRRRADLVLDGIVGIGGHGRPARAGRPAGRRA